MSEMRTGLLYVVSAAFVIASGVCVLQYANAQVRPAARTILIRHYPVTVHRVVDADTVDLDVELGLEVYTRTRVRLAGIDAWEVRGPERPRGLAAAEFTSEWLRDSEVLEIRAGDTRGFRRGKYGRWIVQLCKPDSVCLNDELVRAGHAERSEE